MVTYEIESGMLIDEAAHHMIFHRNHTGDDVMSVFNGIELTATEDATASQIVKNYWTEWERQKGRSDDKAKQQANG